ncbi:RHS Repeat protein [compost metagenome]
MTTSTSVHSNAFNFMSFLQSGVDPRTGQYTVSISLPDVKTNDLRGPGVPLVLTYNPLNTLDSGFGRGWNLQLSQYTPGNQVLSLNSGETFKVTGSANGQLVMKEKKLDSFHFYEHSSNRYRIMHKSGLVEILEVLGSTQNRVAMPVEIYSPEGYKVTLGYEMFNGAPMLAWIKDDAEQILLTIKRESVFVEVLLQPFGGPDGGPLARFVMTLTSTDRYVSRISLPTDNLASWHFDYEFIRDHLCIKKVQTPTGGLEEVFYQDNGHQFPVGSGRTALPRVTRHLTTADSSQPQIDVRYTYPAEKNFLGFGLALAWDDDGLDNLYKHIGSYEYTSVETLWVTDEPTEELPNPVPYDARKIERTFNQFHLLTSEVTTQNKNVKKVETTYNLTPNVPFEQQPAYCQLPKENKSTWELLGSPNKRRSETASMTYDNFGNLLTQTHANGVIETSTWYPAAIDPEGFVRHLKDQTITPAASPDGQAPTLRTSYAYTSLPPLAGSSLANWLTVENQVLAQMAGGNATELERTEFEYTNEPADGFLHGRVKRQTVTLNDKATLTEYEYSKLDSPEFKESVLQTKETLTGFGHLADRKNVQKIVTLQHSLLNGEPLLNRDDNDVEIRSVYDELRRVIRVTVAPGTDFEASRHYQYFLCANAGDKAEQWMFDVKGVKTCTRFDGLNRVTYEERDDADNPSPGSPPRQTYAGTHDAFGNLVKESEFDWDGTWERTLTTEYEFDDWGQQYCVTGPDGVKTFEETDPIGSEDSKGPIQRSWRVGEGASPQVSGVTETWLNLFEKPTRIERFNLAKQSISLHRFFYDGLGRTHKEIVGFGEVQRVTQFGYDNFDRLVENILPVNAVVHRRFAPHSREDLPTLISVNNIVLGEQAFDGLSRRIEAITGGRIQKFDYKPGQTQPWTVTTPSGEVIEYDYAPQLGEEPVLRRLPRAGAKGLFDEATYIYDKENARLLYCQEQGVALTREYYSTGEQKSETRTEEGGEYIMHYRYSRLGRLRSYTDVLGQEQCYRHDAKGRLVYTQLGTTASTFAYDSLGRTATIATVDSAGGQRVGITLQYDEFDREVLREFDLNGVKQQLTQVYDDVDCLVQRTLKEGATVLRDETYHYDLRGRLTRYDCAGTQPPVDPYNKAITRQTFSFSEPDNLRIVVTHFPGGSNRAIYSYDGVDPAQLSKVVNNHADYPREILLDYNADGHLIRDEEGRTLEYDSLGRLISVSDSGGGASNSYNYDPRDTLVGMNDGGGQEQRFYQGDKLANQIKGSNSSTFIRGEEVVLAEHQAGADPKSLLMAGDHHNSVLSEVSKTGRKDVVYSAFGYRAQDVSVSSSLGYNGERREEATGCYSLGNGYRVFSPGLMRFVSPDSESPFAKGGLNPYAYCEWNPVNYVDPTGKVRFFPMWLTKMVAGLFGKTASTGTKGASAGAKSAKAASSNMTAAKGTNTAAKTVKSVAKETFEGGKISRKGAISNGRVKDGFWDSLENGKIELHLNRGSTNVPKLADVTGPKFVDGLEDPLSGFQRLKARVESPDSMFQSMVKGVGKDWRQAAEAMESVRNR